MADKIQSKQILFATLGSLGDLHPCIGMALELMRRGHKVAIATTEYYRQKIERPGNWVSSGSSQLGSDRWGDDPAVRGLKRGPEILIRQMVLPHLRETYEDTLEAATGADLMVAGEMNYAAPLVAEKLKLRWASATLSPASFCLSPRPFRPGQCALADPCAQGGLASLSRVLNLGRLGTRHWWDPVRELRREQGLDPDCDPLFRDKFSPELALVLFSSQLARKQPDWPAQTLQPGFVFYDAHGSGVGDDLGRAEFFGAGDATGADGLTGADGSPIVFTQGSTAVHSPGSFYEVSAEAARKLGWRALLLGTNTVPGIQSPGIRALPYAPYSHVFPKAAVIVHQGGSGTTGQALRAGRPQLIVPFGWDQPDNATRVARMGAGIHLPRSKYSVEAAVRALERLLGEKQFSGRAAEVGEKVRSENGLGGACDAIESLLAR